MRYILASMSPRRSELLSSMGLEFEICPADIDENIGVNNPEKLVTMLALLKASFVASKYTDQEVVVIAADTVVAIDGEILGKPSDELDAHNMLRKLSGKKHTVYTGYCCARADNGNMVSRCAKADVYFREISDKEIEDYIKTGEPMDKAGAYGIQGIGRQFVLRTKGEFSCVMGLPVEALGKLLKEEFSFEGGE
ncbi:MAG: Maf family protein [Bacillota bacterium]|nr:Maf family protein [Bacillota bacterium]